MSIHHLNTTEALSPYTRDRSADGPTGTSTHQRRFAQRLRGVLRRINARIREVMTAENFATDTEALVDDPPDVFDYPRNEAKAAALLAWLRDQLDTGFLGVVGEDTNQFIRAAYAVGIRESQQQLSDMDVAFTRPDVDNLLSRPIHRSTLQTLYTRTYENLVSVRDDVAQAVREELVTGLLEGRNPRDIGRGMTDRIDSIGKHRATMIARSETMNAYSEGFLNRTDELADEGDFDVAVSHKEWLTARDDRVCPICSALDGINFTTSEMRNNAFEIGGTTFRLRPPAHPNCRCSMTVSLGVTADDVAPLDERLPSEEDIQQ